MPYLLLLISRMPLAVATIPNPGMVAPFLLLLGAIAIVPFINHRWWEKSYHLVAVVLGGITAGYYLLALHAGGRLVHLAHEYATFIALISSLYVAAGGIHIRTKGESTPLINCLWLLGGAILANFLGTTGASMLLIRPWIGMNRYRITGFHIVFFIFIVSNAGGCLTPIGDPPLFLGFLKGVPFWWVAERCVIPWAVTVGSLTGIFYLLDRANYARAPESVRREHTTSESWAILGWHNLVFLAVIIAAVFIENPLGVREFLMFAAAAGSYFTTPRPIHEANNFTFHPIKEVAWLFLGIFATMAPALDTLELHASSLGLDSPLKLYAVTGLLSGLLDNAPTYLTFLAAGLGNHGLSIDQTTDVAAYVAHHGSELRAISLGAVFFGALTYIGNGPNFMVKAIAENAGVKTPSFFGYLAKFALPYLGPVLGVVAVIWFRR